MIKLDRHNAKNCNVLGRRRDVLDMQDYNRVCWVENDNMFAFHVFMN